VDIDGQAQVWVFTAYGGNLRGGHYPNADGDPGRFEYLGDRIYGDFTADPYEQDPQQMVTVQRTYLSPWAHMEAGGFEPVYYHADHLGTTRLLSQQGQGAYNVLSHVYTAFGEADSVPASPPGDAATRYGYVGAHGYETGLLTFTGGEDTFPITLQHVGERWYDPALGRFLQRDPIGIYGGLNVYSYEGASPVNGADPLGLAQAADALSPPVPDWVWPQAGSPRPWSRSVCCTTVERLPSGQTSDNANRGRPGRVSRSSGDTGDLNWFTLFLSIFHQYRNVLRGLPAAVDVWPDWMKRARWMAASRLRLEDVQEDRTSLGRTAYSRPARSSTQQAGLPQGANLSGATLC
jgi:RHS repeat-associated protein